jgi:hypothetical protein
VLLGLGANAFDAASEAKVFLERAILKGAALKEGHRCEV